AALFASNTEECSGATYNCEIAVLLGRGRARRRWSSSRSKGQNAPDWGAIEPQDLKAFLPKRDSSYICDCLAGLRRRGESQLERHAHVASLNGMTIYRRDVSNAQGGREIGILNVFHEVFNIDFQDLRPCLRQCSPWTRRLHG